MLAGAYINVMINHRTEVKNCLQYFVNHEKCDVIYYQNTLKMQQIYKFIKAIKSLTKKCRVQQYLLHGIRLLLHNYVRMPLVQLLAKNREMCIVWYNIFSVVCTLL